MRFSPATPRSLKTSGVLGFANSDSPTGSIKTSLASCRTSSRLPDLPSLAQSRGLRGFTASGVGCPDDDAQAGEPRPLVGIVRSGSADLDRRAEILSWEWN